MVDDAKKIGKDISHKLRETVLFHYDPIEAIENGEDLEGWMVESFKDIFIKDKPSERDVNFVKGMVLKKFGSWAMAEKAPDVAIKQVLTLLRILKPQKHQLS